MKSACVIWLTGIPAAGKSTIAQSLAQDLRGHGLWVEVLDGDEIRKSLSADLGFSREDREQHNRRVIFLSKLLARNGVVSVVPLISPFRAIRQYAREEIGRYLEVWVKCSVEECIRRDPKGLYKQALQGEISNLTGLQDVYENPENAELILDTEILSVDECVQRIVEASAARGYI